jgi:hypothetical protein
MAEQLPASREVAGRPEVVEVRPAGQRERRGGHRGDEEGADARDAESVGNGPAERTGAERGQHHIGARGDRRDQPLAELFEKVGEHRPPGLRRRGRDACPRHLDRITGQRPVLQAASAHETGEQAVRGDHNPMTRLLEPLTQTCERCDLTARARRDDQNAHVPNVSARDSRPVPSCRSKAGVS